MHSVFSLTGLFNHKLHFHDTETINRTTQAPAQEWTNQIQILWSLNPNVTQKYSFQLSGIHMCILLNDQNTFCLFRFFFASYSSNFLSYLKKNSQRTRRWNKSLQKLWVSAKIIFGNLETECAQGTIISNGESGKLRYETRGNFYNLTKKKKEKKNAHVMVR